MADISKIVLPDNSEYDVKDVYALHATDNGSGGRTSDGWQQLKLKSNGTTLPRYDILDSGGNTTGTFMTAADTNGDIRIYGLNNGTQTSGAYLENGGRLVLFGHNNEIILRPNGATSTSGQVIIDTAGDVHRTPKTYSKSASSTSLAVGNNKIYEISGIEAGRYLIVANYGITLTSSSTSHVYTNLYKSSSTSSTIMYSGHALNRNSEFINDTTYASFGSNGVISLYIENNVAATVNNATLSLLRLA